MLPGLKIIVRLINFESSPEMKIAIIRQKYTSSGGAERFVQNALMSLQHHSDVQVDILARKWKEVPGVNFVKINPFHFGSLWRDLSFAKGACDYINKNRYDIVQSHERIPGCNIYRAGDGLHVKWLSLRKSAGFQASKFNLYHSYILNAEREMFNSSELRHVICNSKMVMDEISYYFPVAKDKCRLIYNGVDLQRFSYPVNSHVRRLTRQRLGLKEDQPVLVFVGSGFQRKGLRKAVDAVHASSKEVALIVVGGDKNQQQYASYARSILGESRAIFVGETRPDEYLTCADAFILPTLYDPFPNSAMEAFASGLPVLTTKQCGAAEIIEENQNGYVFDFFNVKQQSLVIQQWLDNRLRWNEMRHKARDAVSLMTIESATNEMLSLYRKMTNGT